MFHPSKGDVKVFVVVEESMFIVEPNKLEEDGFFGAQFKRFLHDPPFFVFLSQITFSLSIFASNEKNGSTQDEKR